MTLSTTSPSTDDQDQIIVDFGKKIFEAMDRNRPSAFSKNFWSGRIMAWAMKRPEFKLNMFRLVDVLPTLTTSAQIAQHVTEYLGPVAANMDALSSWGLNLNPNSLRAKLAAFTVKRSVGQMASQFIAGATPNSALKPLKRLRARRIAFTCDLLGEFSLSEFESTQYLDRYLSALDIFGNQIPKWKESRAIIQGHPGEISPVCISVKLTALYSQCSVLNIKKSVEILSEKLAQIVERAQRYGAILYVDAEDMGNNEIIYAVFREVFSDSRYRSFPYPGIVVQAYAKESRELLGKLLTFAKDRKNSIAVRLVKGAYWDYETVVAHQNGWPSPLFAHKQSSDANYEILSRFLIDNYKHILPAFGSHNVRSLSHACCYALKSGLSPADFELQMLFGMADPISDAFVKAGFLVRQYVPLGETLPGMGYLIRRLLENTSNESFLRHTFFDSDEVESLLKEPKMLD